jgi:hypothetical protein
VLINEVLPKNTKMTKEKYISLAFESCNTCTVSFDLWMSRVGVDTFVLTMHFLNDKWELCHVTIGFFEIVETSKNTMALQVNEVFAKHGLNAWVIAYVKNEGGNLSTMTIALTSIVSCEVLGLTTPFVGACWGHAMSKCCQYATDDSKVCVGLTFILSRKHNPFCKKLSHGPKKWEGTTRVA